VSAGPAAAHRPAVRRSPSPRVPRRVSGPARGRVRTAPRAAPRPRVATSRAAAPAVALPQIPRLVDVLAGLPDSRWLDRLLRGRAWIALIALALIGLVFMQVSMLKLNAGIGQSVERSATLERQNADLRATVSQLSSEERIQRAAADMGLIMPPAGDIRYLRSRSAHSDAVKAARIMREPTPAAQQAAAAAAAQPQVTTPPPTPAAQAAQTQQPAPVATAPSETAQPQAEAAQPQPQPAAPEQTAAAPEPQPQAAPQAGAAVAPGPGQ
jgi:cell division protein FtsL